MALQGVLLDVDGTLVLSNDIHAQAWVDAFATFGYDVTFEQVRPMMGMGGDQIIPKLFPGLNGKEGEGKAIASYRRKLILNDLKSEIRPARGTRDLVLRLRERGLRLMVATSASPEELELMLKIAQVDDVVQDSTSSKDANASKPAPDIVQAALEKSEMAASEAIMLGDTPYDIESAGKAGVAVIALRCGGFSDEQLSGAIAIYDDPADVLEHYEDSPLNR